MWVFFSLELFRSMFLNFQVSKNLEIFQISLLLIYNLFLCLGDRHYIISVLWNLLRLVLWLSLWLNFGWLFPVYLKPFLLLILSRRGKTSWIENKTASLSRLRCGSDTGCCVTMTFLVYFLWEGMGGSPPCRINHKATVMKQEAI